MEETKKNEQLIFEAKVIKTMEGGSIPLFRLPQVPFWILELQLAFQSATGMESTHS